MMEKVPSEGREAEVMDKGQMVRESWKKWQAKETVAVYVEVVPGDATVVPLWSECGLEERLHCCVQERLRRGKFFMSKLELLGEERMPVWKLLVTWVVPVYVYEVECELQDLAKRYSGRLQTMEMVENGEYAGRFLKCFLERYFAESEPSEVELEHEFGRSFCKGSDHKRWNGYAMWRLARGVEDGVGGIRGRKVSEAELELKLEEQIGVCYRALSAAMCAQLLLHDMKLLYRGGKVDGGS